MFFRATEVKRYRAARHERAIELIQNKLRLTYNLTDAAFALPEHPRTFMQQHFEAFTHGDKWHETLSLALDNSRESDPRPYAEKIKAVHEAAQKIFTLYTDGFWTRHHIRTATIRQRDQKCKPGFYTEEHTRITIANILVNHVSNLAEASLREAGLNAKSAHLTHSALVGESIAAYKQYKGSSKAIPVGDYNIGVEPEISRTNKSIDAVEAQIKAIADYWQDQGDALNHNYKRYDANTSPFTGR